MVAVPIIDAIIPDVAISIGYKSISGAAIKAAIRSDASIVTMYDS